MSEDRDEPIVDRAATLDQIVERIDQDLGDEWQARLKSELGGRSRQWLEDQLVQHVPEELRDTLRTAFQTPANKRTDEQNAHLKKYPKILKISRGSLYLYDREIRVKASASSITLACTASR